MIEAGKTYVKLGPYEVLEVIDSYITGDLSIEKLRVWARQFLLDPWSVHDDWFEDDASVEESYRVFWNALSYMSRAEGQRSEVIYRLNAWANLLIDYYQLLPGIDLKRFD